MDVIVNPTLPLYIDDSAELIRLGGLPRTGKILSPADTKLRKLFRMCGSEPQSIDKIVEFFSGKYHVEPSEMREVISQLIDEKILLPYSDVQQLTIDNKLKDKHCSLLCSIVLKTEFRETNG